MSARECLDPSEIATSPPFLDTYSVDDLFTEFSAVSEDDVRRIIASSPTKSCSMDPIPTSVLRKVARLLIPAITSIVNLSIQSGSYHHRSQPTELITPRRLLFSHSGMTYFWLPAVGTAVLFFSLI